MKAGFGRAFRMKFITAMVISPILGSETPCNGILAFTRRSAPPCPYGVDINVAYRSVDILAETLLGYCFQTAQMVYNATGWHSSLAVDYPTIWKLTLMNYNAGTQCTYDTIMETFEYIEGPMRWSDVSANVSGEACIRGLAYANQITAKAFDFPPP